MAIILACFPWAPGLIIDDGKCVTHSTSVFQLERSFCQNLERRITIKGYRDIIKLIYKFRLKCVLILSANEGQDIFFGILTHDSTSWFETSLSMKPLVYWQPVFGAYYIAKEGLLLLKKTYYKAKEGLFIQKRINRVTYGHKNTLSGKY